LTPELPHSCRSGVNDPGYRRNPPAGAYNVSTSRPVSAPDRPESRAAMPFVVRAIAFCLLVCGAAGCGGSNNKSKIEGRWTIVAGGDHPDEARLRDKTLVFDEEGQVLFLYPGVPTPGPMAPPRPPGSPEPVAWRYKLLAGDGADFYGLPPDASKRDGLFPGARGAVRVTVRIEFVPGGKHERREMTLTDAEGRSLRLVRNRG
jgi:hypothetical protein